MLERDTSDTNWACPNAPGPIPDEGLPRVEQVHIQGVPFDLVAEATHDFEIEEFLAGEDEE